MNAVIGYIVGGEYYCPDCTPSTDEMKSEAIFVDSNADSWLHCCTCESLIPEHLTSDGLDSVLRALRDFLVRRSGRPEILRQWAEELHGSLRLEPGEAEAVALVREATDEAAIEATIKKLTGPYLRQLRYMKEEINEMLGEAD